MTFNHFHLLFSLTIVCALLGATTANAQFDISWFTVDGGGGYSAGGAFELEGTIGQHDAGSVMTGGNFSLSGGFWAGGSVPGPVVTVADSIIVFRGNQIGGILEDTFASDDSRMLFNPGFTINSNEAPVWLIFDAALPSDNPSSLQIVMESQAGTPGLTGTMEAWNWQTSAYDEVDVNSATFNSDTVITVELSGNINDYVQIASGAVRTRIGWRKTGFTINYPWEIRLDQFVWLSQ